MSTIFSKPLAGSPAPLDFHWTVDSFRLAADAGAFGLDARLELIRGRIIDRMGQGPLHSSLAGYFADCLRAALSPRLTVREERPLSLSFDSEPVPDISVVTGGQLDYLNRHPIPGDVALLVEVAASSEENDLGDRALLYAQAGIGDYWVVLPERGQLVVHRDPSPGGYASTTTLGLGETVAALASPGATLCVAHLLGVEDFS